MGITNLNEIEYGFEWGGAKVTRLFSFERTGAVTIGIDTKKASAQIYVTKTGKIRVHVNGKEWKESK